MELFAWNFRPSPIESLRLWYLWNRVVDGSVGEAHRIGSRSKSLFKYFEFSNAMVSYVTVRRCIFFVQDVTKFYSIERSAKENIKDVITVAILRALTYSR